MDAFKRKNAAVSWGRKERKAARSRARAKLKQEVRKEPQQPEVHPAELETPPEEPCDPIEVGDRVYLVPRALRQAFAEAAVRRAEELRNSGMVLAGWFVADQALIDRMTLSVAFRPELWGEDATQH